MRAEKMFEKLGYVKDKEPLFGVLVSYSQYCVDGCCRLNSLTFYKNGFETDEGFINLELLNAINKQIEELKDVKN